MVVFHQQMVNMDGMQQVLIHVDALDQPHRQQK